MAAKTRFPLVMNGTEVRTLGELRNSFDGDALFGAALGGIICAALDDDDLDLFSNWA